jgi:hypothetical protein
MYHRTVISSFAAVAIGMSCVATDASARGGGGGGVGGRSGVVTAPAPGIHSSITGGSYFAASGVRLMPRVAPMSGGFIQGGNSKYYRQVLGPGTGDGAAGAAGGAAGARYYAPASYNSNAAYACGHYPYPPCNGVPAR